MIRDYVHYELGQEIQSISGTYITQKELSLEHNGRDILCIVGTAVVDTACCGSGSFLYATVPGYVLAWKAKNNEAGLAISEVQPIDDETAKQAVASTLKQKENIYNVNFL